MEKRAVLFVLLAATSALAYMHETAAVGPEKRRTGNVCSTDLQCPDNAFCKSGSYCVCKEGYVYAATENDDRECLKAAGYADQCNHHIQCQTSLGVHGECYLNICSCKNSSHLSNSRCYKTSLIGEQCLTDYNCELQNASEQEQAFCVRGFCSCQLHYSGRNNGTRCVRDAKLGEKCEDEQQCAGVGFLCRDTCRCKPGFTPHNDSKTCVKTVEKLGDSCNFAVQCDHLSGGRTSGTAICLYGQCSCGFNARARGEPSHCWYIRRPGQPCQADEECYSEEDELGFCRAGVCTCIGCVPDLRDFADDSTAIASVPLLAAILAAAAILI